MTLDEPQDAVVTINPASILHLLIQRPLQRVHPYRPRLLPGLNKEQQQ